MKARPPACRGETVRYRLECLYTAQTVGLPLIHTVLDFGRYAVGLSAYASHVSLSSAVAFLI